MMLLLKCSTLPFNQNTAHTEGEVASDEIKEEENLEGLLSDDNVDAEITFTEEEKDDL